ncbi:MAG: hypothetical protein SNJ59_15560 [Aggregatilineales bacterium]
MMLTRFKLIAILLMLLTVISGVALAQNNDIDADDNDIAAQPETEADDSLVLPPTEFIVDDDGRINQGIHLGGVGVYCEDALGEAGTSFEDGGIAVWSITGERLIFVPEDELLAGLTTELEAQGQEAAGFVLLAEADGPFGPLALWRVGTAPSFQLRGVYEDGKPFVFGWSVCGGEDTFLITDGQLFVVGNDDVLEAVVEEDVEADANSE